MVRRETFVVVVRVLGADTIQASRGRPTSSHSFCASPRPQQIPPMDPFVMRNMSLAPLVAVNQGGHPRRGSLLDTHRPPQWTGSPAANHPHDLHAMMRAHHPRE